MRKEKDNRTGFDPGLPFLEFLELFKQNLANQFHDRNDINRLSLQRGLPTSVMDAIMSSKPLATFIPTAYGGRGGKIREGLALASAASYESLALSLMFGINWALFLQPVAKYGQEKARSVVFKNVLEHGKMGGLMITEPDYGSDALHMQSCYTEEDGSYRLQGTKHWAGLTGMADYWLLTARKRTGTGDLARDVDFFICDVGESGQQIVVEEFFENLGLYMIPYGRNRIDVRIPGTHRLVPHSSGIKMMLDILHRSRMQFPGMATGFVQRMLDDALKHCRDRMVGGRSLFDYDQVQQRLMRLQGAFTICSAMSHHSSGRSAPANDMAPLGLEANAIKTVATDLMQESSQSFLQLSGAKGYRLDHIAGRSTVDSRPFQIFEGSNDILYIQVAESILKKMKSVKESNLYRFLSGLELAARPVERLKSLLDVELGSQLAQRRLVDLGRVVSRVITMQFVCDIGDNGFRADLVENSLAMLHRDIAGLMGAFAVASPATVVEGYQEGGSWFELGGETA